MGHDSLAHQDVIKDAFIQQNLAFVRLHCRKPSAEIMAIDDLAELRVDVLLDCDVFLDEFMNAGDAEP